MLDRWFRTACCVALALLVALSLPARADDTFTVTGVHEDVTAASALAARDKAQAAGQAKAFATLMDRVAGGKVPHLGAAEITDLVIGFEVANERTSTVRYAADYTFHFNQAAVRRLVEGASVDTRGPGATLDATVTASSLTDWIAVRNRLRTIAQVRGTDLVSFDRDQIRVAIRFVGDPEQLRTALGAHGLALGGAAPDWTLALQGQPTAETPPVPAAPPGAPPPSPAAPPAAAPAPPGAPPPDQPPSPDDDPAAPAAE